MVVARTRMRHNHVCIGGHDLDQGFKGVRLLDLFGDHHTESSTFSVGDVYEVDYLPSESARRPHVEDVYVRTSARIGAIDGLLAFLSARVHPWAGGPSVLFDGMLHVTSHGAGYVPVNGPKPGRSTGYWTPDADMTATSSDSGIRLRYPSASGITRLTWVGACPCPNRIEAGTLIRVSLSRAFTRPGVPEGYYLQVSGIFLGEADTLKHE